MQGVGAANRDQIEKAFFRALTVLLPSNATFALTRAATIQAARDLYGAGSAAERAITQAWDAVGVQPRTAATVASCPTRRPDRRRCAAASAPAGHRPHGLRRRRESAHHRLARATTSMRPAGSSTPDDGDGAKFAAFFGSCGPRSDRILAQTDACAALCVNLEGATSGSTQFTFHAVDDAGRAITLTDSARHASDAAMTRLLAGAWVVLAASTAGAQPVRWTDRGYVIVDGAARITSASFAGVARPVTFVEPAEVDTSYRVRQAPTVDVAAGARVWRNLAVGADVAFFTRGTTAAVDAQGAASVRVRQAAIGQRRCVGPRSHEDGAEHPGALGHAADADAALADRSRSAVHRCLSSGRTSCGM